jgi:hypothetical protein
MEKRGGGGADHNLGGIYIYKHTSEKEPKYRALKKLYLKIMALRFN